MLGFCWVDYMCIPDCSRDTQAQRGADISLYLLKMQDFLDLSIHLRTLNLFRSPEAIPLPKPVSSAVSHKETMEQYIVQHQKMVLTSTWPCCLPDFSIPCTYMMPGLPAKAGNYHSTLSLHIFIESLPILMSIFLVCFLRVMPFH